LEKYNLIKIKKEIAKCRRPQLSASVLMHSDNMWIYGFASGYAQISQGETSHIPGTLSEMAGNKWRRPKRIKQ